MTEGADNLTRECFILLGKKRYCNIETASLLFIYKGIKYLLIMIECKKLPEFWK